MPVSDQGIFHNRYQIIPRVLIFATHGENILLLKGSSNKRIWANLYNGIGGHIEKGESVKEAAFREFNEETGLILINPWLCALVTIDTQQIPGIGMYIFRGKTSNGQINSSKEGIPEWISRKDALDLNLVEDLPIIIPKIMNLKENDPPLFAQYSYKNNGELFIRFTE